MRTSTVLLAALSASLCAAEESLESVSITSSPAAARAKPATEAESSLSLRLRYDRYGRSNLNVEYGARWDFYDLKRLPRGVGRRLRAPLRGAGRLGSGLFRNSSVGFEGVTVRPSDAWKRVEAPAPSSEPDEDGGEPAGESVARARRRRRLSLDPVVAGIKRDLKREIRRGLITESFDLVLPQSGGYSFSQKEALYRDLKRLPAAWGEGH